MTIKVTERKGVGPKMSTLSIYRYMLYGTFCNLPDTTTNVHVIAFSQSGQSKIHCTTSIE